MKVLTGIILIFGITGLLGFQMFYADKTMELETESGEVIEFSDSGSYLHEGKSVRSLSAETKDEKRFTARWALNNISAAFPFQTKFGEG